MSTTSSRTKDSLKHCVLKIVPLREQVGRTGCDRECKIPTQARQWELGVKISEMVEQKSVRAPVHVQIHCHRKYSNWKHQRMASNVSQ